jgi:hypothetical protein
MGACNTVALASSLPPPNTKYMIVGVSGGLQDGFPERDKMDYKYYDPVNNTTTIIPALFIGKALIRGYKAFLDVMEPGYRQYVVCFCVRNLFIITHRLKVSPLILSRIYSHAHILQG